MIKPPNSPIREIVKLIKEFNWAFNSKVASWICEKTTIRKEYRYSIRSAIPLLDGTGVALVEPMEQAGRDNAVVFDANGTERFRLVFPLPEPHGHCFDQMYYVQGRLTAFANLRGADFGYVLDEKTGEVLKSFESR